MAPEIHEKIRYSYQADVYSYSMIVYEIVSGRRPFIEKKYKDVLKFIRDVVNNVRPNLSVIKSQYIKDFLQMCWNKNPQERTPINVAINLITNREFYSNFTDLDRQEVIKYLNTFGDEFNYIIPKFLDQPAHVQNPAINHPRNRDLTPDEVRIISEIIHIPDSIIRETYRNIGDQNQSDIEKLLEITERPRVLVEFLYEFSNNYLENVVELCCCVYKDRSQPFENEIVE